MGTPDHPSCEWGTVTSDGAGHLALSLERNVDGSLDPDPYTGTMSYEADPDGSIGILDRTDPDLRVMAGRVAKNGRLAALAKRVADEQPTLLLLERREGTYSDASISGLYVTAGFMAQPAATSFFGGASIGGSGTGTATLGTNKEGGVAAPSDVPLTYSVAANGDTTMAIGVLTGLVGGTFRSGDLVVVAGSATDGVAPGLFAFVRSSSGRTLADLSGTYAFVGWRWLGASDRYLSMAGTLTADGAGTYTTLVTRTDGVVVQEDVAGGGTYDISAAGAISLHDATGDVYNGALSPDGAFAIAAGALDTPDDPAFFFLHR